MFDTGTCTAASLAQLQEGAAQFRWGPHQLADGLAAWEPRLKQAAAFLAQVGAAILADAVHLCVSWQHYLSWDAAGSGNCSSVALLGRRTQAPCTSSHQQAAERRLLHAHSTCLLMQVAAWAKHKPDLAELEEAAEEAVPLPALPGWTDLLAGAAAAKAWVAGAQLSADGPPVRTHPCHPWLWLQIIVTPSALGLGLHGCQPDHHEPSLLAGHCGRPGGHVHGGRCPHSACAGAGGKCSGCGLALFT